MEQEFFFERVHVLAANPCRRGWYACLTSEKSFCGIISQESRELNMAFYVFTFLHDYKTRSRLNCHEEELIFVKMNAEHPFTEWTISHVSDPGSLLTCQVPRFCRVVAPNHNVISISLYVTVEGCVWQGASYHWNPEQCMLIKCV